MPDAVEEPLASGNGSDRVLADVVGLVALNQLTGSFNLVAGLEPATEQARPGAA